MAIIKEWAERVLEKIQATALAYGAKRLMAALGLGKPTVYNSVGPGSLTDLGPSGRPRHQLWVIDWIEIQQLTGDHTSLDEAAKVLGLLTYALPKPGRDSNDFLKLQATAAKEHGEAANKLLGAMSVDSPGGRELTPEEREACAREHYEAAQAHMALYVALDEKS